jgi:DNA polymerase-3 subunit gamma/tau
MSMATDYRPTTLDELVGNKAEIETLKRLLESEKHPQTYLFSGPAGCGKTTTARIVAQMVGADNVIELNSADNRGIDTARNIIETLQFVSTSPTVYILDDVHKTTADFQNAMLQVLEEPPPYAYFILCSSEPTKLIAAVKSRCTPVQFKPLSESDMIILCKRVAKAEGIKLGVDVLEAVADRSGGSPRDALLLLAKVLVPDMAVEQALDILAEPMIDSTTLDLCRKLLNGENWKEVTAVLNSLETKDWESVRYAVLGYMAAVLSKTDNRTAARAIDAFSEPFYNTGRAGLVLACYRAYK